MPTVTLERMIGLGALWGLLARRGSPRVLARRGIVQCRRPPWGQPICVEPPIPPTICGDPPEQKPCFDMREVSFERGSACHAKLIRSFLYCEYFPREPCNVSLWMPLDSPYLQTISEKYSNSGDRFLAFERQPRTNEHRLVGVAVASKVFPWTGDECEEWAQWWPAGPECNRLLFAAHCLRSPNLFNAYKTDNIYNVEVVVTAQDVQGQGVATELIKWAVAHALEAQYPLTQVIATSVYVAKICKTLGMKRSWAMDYADYVDTAGQRVFLPRRPHLSCSVYTKKFQC